jgi:hypothetical protein
VSSDDPQYDGIVADGIDLSVARPGQGMVIITESGTGTVVYEGGCFSLDGLGCGADVIPLPSIDSYTVRLAIAPTCDNADDAADCLVYVTVSAARSPQEEQPHRLPDEGPQDDEGETILLATSDGFPGGPEAFLRQISLQGDVRDIFNRAVVLVFDGTNWDDPQTVWVYAVDDAAPEGDRVVTISHSVRHPQACTGPEQVSDDPLTCFDGALVRNVEVMIHDNDLADVRLVQRDPFTSGEDGNTVVIEGFADGFHPVAGHPGTALSDIYDILPAIRPQEGETVTVRIELSDSRVCLSSTDPRFREGTTGDPTACALDDQPVYFAVFTADDWLDPVRVTVYARNDDVPNDLHNSAIIHALHREDIHDLVVNVPFTTDPNYLDAAPSILRRLDVLVYDDETADVFVLESDGSTLVTLCGDEECTLPGTGDDYLVRLTKAPSADVEIAVITDGQTDVLVDATSDPRISMQAIGGLRTTQLFVGTIAIDGAVVTRANGSDLGSFLDDGFFPGYRIRISGAGLADGDYTIEDVDHDRMTLGQGPAGVCDPCEGVTISRLLDRGLYTGQISYDADARMLRRVDGSSWLDSRFYEGQLIKIDGIDELLKIESFGTTEDCGTCVLDRLILTRAASAVGDLSDFGPQLRTVTQWAAVITFTAPTAGHVGDWFDPVTIVLVADIDVGIDEARANLRSFPKQAHRLSRIRGPLMVEGGTTAVDRSLRQAVLLPGENNGPLFAVPPQPSESHQIDTLNVYSDGSRADLVGELTATALTGLGMVAEDLDFRHLLCDDVDDPATCSFPFGEPGVYPAGISYATIRVNPGTGLFDLDDNASTIEVLNVLLGSGNDDLTIHSTLTPGPDTNPDGSVGQVANHGGLTVVHGGGNRPLTNEPEVSIQPGTGVTDPHRLTRTDGHHWGELGFAIGQTVAILVADEVAGTWTVVGFDADGDDHGAVLLVAGEDTMPDLSAVRSTVAVVDVLHVTGDFTLEPHGFIAGANSIIRQDGQPWHMLGFAAGQEVYITGIGLRTVLGFDNHVAADGTLEPGAVLLVDGDPFGLDESGDVIDGVVVVANRFQLTADYVLDPGDRTLTLGGSLTGEDLVAAGLRVGMQVAVSGVVGYRTIAGIDGNVITLHGGNLPGLSVEDGLIAAVWMGGDTITVTGGASTTAAGGPGGCSSATECLPSPLVIYGDTSQDGVWYSGSAAQMSLHNFGAKPMPWEDDVTVTIERDSNHVGTITRSDGESWTTVGFAVGQQLAMGTAEPLASLVGEFLLDGNQVVSRDGRDWETAGFAVGQQVVIAGSEATRLVTGFGDHPTFGDGSVLLVTGQPLTPTVSVSTTVTAISAYVGVISEIVEERDSDSGDLTGSTLLLNLVLDLEDLPEAAFPVEVDGDPITDEVRNFRTINRIGNGPADFIFPSRTPSPTPATTSSTPVRPSPAASRTTTPARTCPASGSPSTAAPGSNTIIGSQTGDHIAGGGGDDIILGQRGNNHIYGDAGFNVDHITRVLTVATAAPSPHPNKDPLLGGDDLIWANGPGSAHSDRSLTYGDAGVTYTDFDSIVFGDLGEVIQDVHGPGRHHPRCTGTAAEAPDHRAAHHPVDRVAGAAERRRRHHLRHAGLRRPGRGHRRRRDRRRYGDDLIFGDNVVTERRDGVITSLRFQTLCGHMIYSRSDRTDGDGSMSAATSSPATPAVCC